jgi:hypothetical protein
MTYTKGQRVIVIGVDGMPDRPGVVKSVLTHVDSVWVEYDDRRQGGNWWSFPNVRPEQTAPRPEPNRTDRVMTNLFDF